MVHFHMLNKAKVVEGVEKKSQATQMLSLLFQGIHTFMYDILDVRPKLQVVLLSELTPRPFQSISRNVHVSVCLSCPGGSGTAWTG